MKSSAYWKQRFEDLDKSLLSMGDRYYYDEVEKQFRLATREIEKEISVWYKRLAANNDISMADAKALLAGKDLQEFRWSVEDYIKHGKEYGISGKWAKELENASARVHITQLDALKLQMQQQLEVLYGNQVDGLDQKLKDIYSEGFYKTAYEVDKGIGVGSQLRQLDDNRLASVVSKPWCSDGKIFSDRLWRDKDALNSTLQREFSQAVIRGDGLDKVVQNVTKRMDVATSSAARLVATESAFFATASQRDCFSMLGVQQYQFVATLDDRTSDTCQDMDGKVYDMKDLSPGTNAPPMHCWCRSCIVPYFGDNKGTRAARGVNGKTEQVPADMTYPEWKKSFITDEPVPQTMPDPVNKRGQTISFDFKKNDDKFRQSEPIIKSLASEYDTNLEKVTVGAVNGAGDVDMSGATMRLNSNSPDVAIHEFAHTIANSSATKFGVQHDEAFWKEIKRIMHKYMRDVENDTSRWISAYEHSSHKVDEFFAEAFTHAQAPKMGIKLPGKYGSDHTWSDQVLATVDKYFGKDKAGGTAPPSAIIKPSDAHEFKVKGFLSKQKLNNHWSKHGTEYPKMTKDEYLQAAVTLLGKPVNDDVLGHVTADGLVVRYDTKTNDFAKGSPDRGVRTMYKPEDGKAYYDKQREEDLAHGGKA